MGPVEKAVRADVEELGDLSDIEPSLSEMAYTLAHQIDLAASGECEECGAAIPTRDSSVTLPQLNRELRQTLAQLVEGRATDDDDDLGDLGSPD
ncbi:hypothetical protein [Streptomyces sp. NPDC056069]|uniref:hypothetical protein n=1 Tax=Streptomyces sp. NPDC056069 TaxID=3345702 RepID=UPI0035DDE1DC